MAEQSFQQDDGFYNYDYTKSQEQGQSYEMAPGGQYDQFQQFDYSQGYSEQQYGTPYGGNIMTPEPLPTSPYADTGDYDNEPPLMEELGINFDHITQKTLAVLNPLKIADADIMQDTDLAGPMVFCLAFGATLLLAGKSQFGYVYGIGVLGCIAMYFLLNMMSMTEVSAGIIISVLGYCLLPMVILSSTAIILSLKGIVGTILTVVAVIWCSYSASKLFVSALAMDHQQPLVAYPCALVYGVFALLTVF